MLTLYYLTSCPFCLRIRYVLAEKQLPFGRRIVDNEKPPELLEISGGKVPVLLENSLAVRDSTVIAEYLEERFPMPALLPMDARERANIRMAMTDIGSELMTPLEKIVHKRADDPDAVRKKVLEAFGKWESKIGDAGVLFGMPMSFADIWLLSAAELATLLDVDLSTLGPRFRGWLERMRERKSARDERLSL